MTVVLPRSATVTAFFGEGEFDFTLDLGELQDIQEIRKFGPLAMFTRVAGVDWFLEDVTEVLRLGLIGGGMEPQEAKLLVRRTFRTGNVLQCRNLAVKILEAALMGPQEDQIDHGETLGEPMAPTTNADFGNGPPTTDSAAPPDTRQTKSGE